MLDNLQINDILAIIVVAIGVFLLIYFAGKTLVTANLFQQGINFSQQKDYPGAETAFRKVININSTNDVVRLFLGDVLKAQDKMAEATELYQEVIQRSPKNPEAYLRLANILMQQNQQEEATINLRKSQELFQKQRQPQKAARISQVLDKMGSKST
ncbi:tetratricopeptide repeat protein [Anabaena sp. UHCC 0399]|uniref:tetratricopeptide repeat protein n=1 Tax=Anabaena sp. UHCC 0399 TaxID=3110238 RepID=UPI002B1EA562|nr:tetratricopeptide repeat protein [Anabaena sp. UHCC 0399]MEA5568432.1 tetratricopeptide repeat protein [Anabaena sp. UHCC 0399]